MTWRVLPQINIKTQIFNNNTRNINISEEYYLRADGSVDSLTPTHNTVSTLFCISINFRHPTTAFIATTPIRERTFTRVYNEYEKKIKVFIKIITRVQIFSFNFDKIRNRVMREYFI